MSYKVKNIGFSKVELASVKELLASNRLPVEDIGKSEINFYLVEEGNILQACAGVERFSEAGLLRSVAVKDEVKGTGIGSGLVSQVLEQSKVQSIEVLYLLTETAEAFFKNFGFSSIDRSDAPESIKKSSEFAELCPDSAVLMKKIL